MTKLRLTCPCGYNWEYSTNEPIPADVREICPNCNGNPDADAATRTNPAPAVPEALALRPGQVVGGFEILEEINRGGMGVIYKARQQGLDRLVALKVIAPKRVGSAESLRRFKLEVRAAAKLFHPNIVTVFHTDLDGPVPYLAMEYVAGIDLLRLVRLTGPLEVLDACYFIREAAEGLQHAFEQGLVHRDIKPANLMVTPNPMLGKPARAPKVKLLDMGLAMVLDKAESDMPNTQAGVFLGTPDYVSPEQAEDSRQADVRSDLYSLGATLFYILTGEVPFHGTSVVAKLRRQLTEPPPSPAARRPAVGPELDALVRKLMSRNPAERVQTPAELVEALDRLVRGQSAWVQPAHSTGSLAAAIAGPSSSVISTAPLKPVVVQAHAGGVHTMAVGHDCIALVTGGADSTLKVWNPGRMKETRTITGDVGAVEQVVIGPGGRWAASCAVRLTTTEMGVQIWSLQTGVEKRRLRGPADNIRCVAVSTDGKSIAAGSDDGMLWLWSSDDEGPTSGCLRGHAGAVTGVSFVAAGESLLSAGADGTIRQWDPTTGKSRGVTTSPVGAIAALGFGGKRVAVAGAKGLAVRMRDGSFVKLAGHAGAVLCTGVSQDGKLVASGGADATVKVWDPVEGNLLTTLTGHVGPVRAVAFGPDGGVVYSGGEDGTLRRWPIAVGV
jgi:serine/threonine protein kinase